MECNIKEIDSEEKNRFVLIKRLFRGKKKRMISFNFG